MPEDHAAMYVGEPRGELSPHLLVTLTIYPPNHDLYPDAWYVFPTRNSRGVEVDPIDVYILEEN